LGEGGGIKSALGSLRKLEAGVIIVNSDCPMMPEGSADSEGACVGSEDIAGLAPWLSIDGVLAKATLPEDLRERLSVSLVGGNEEKTGLLSIAGEGGGMKGVFTGGEKAGTVWFQKLSDSVPKPRVT